MLAPSCQACQLPGPPSDAWAAVLGAKLTCPVQAQRSAAVKVANRREQAGYAAQQAALESAMAAAHADIVACKAEREEARKIKRQKEEYEVGIASSQLWANACSLLCHSVLQCKSAMSMAGNNQHCPGCVWQSRAS